MVREDRIKNYNFSSQSGIDLVFETNGDDLTAYSDNPINGHILSVDWSFNRTGSVYLTLSGTGEEFFRRNLPSGTGTQISYPRVFSQTATGSIANAVHVPFIANDVLVLNVLNAASGTQALGINVRYK